MSFLAGIYGIFFETDTKHTLSLTLVLLSLLAFDALLERINVLEKIETQLSKLSTNAPLRSREDYPEIDKCGASASNMAFVGVSLYQVIPRNFDFFRRKLQEGCTLQFLMLNPKLAADSPSRLQWEAMDKVRTITHDTEGTVKNLKLLIEFADSLKKRDGIKVKFLDYFAPFGMSMYDPEKRQGEIYVEFHIFKDTNDKRPHVLLTRSNDHKWYEFYQEQFDKLWDSATDWEKVMTKKDE
jgi:hypothetical protein